MKRFYLKFRSYADRIPSGDLWLIAVDGPVAFACLHGEWTRDDAIDLAKALKLDVEIEASPFARREPFFAAGRACFEIGADSKPAIDVEVSKLTTKQSEEKMKRYASAMNEESWL